MQVVLTLLMRTNLDYLQLTLFAIAAYLYGALPYACIATWLFKKRNLAKEGTGNIGVTNAFKAGGMAVGIFTVGGEITKAVFPILTAKYVFEGNLNVTLLFVYLAFLGTSFSIFLKGKGGKGTTVAVWSLLILSPYACMLLLVVWAAVVFISKNNPKIKTIPILLLPVIFHLVENDVYFTTFCLFLSLTIFINNRLKLDDYNYYQIFNSDPLNKKALMGSFKKISRIFFPV